MVKEGPNGPAPPETPVCMTQSLGLSPTGMTIAKLAGQKKISPVPSASRILSRAALHGGSAVRTGTSWEGRAAPPWGSPEEFCDGGPRKGPPREQSRRRMLLG